MGLPLPDEERPQGGEESDSVRHLQLVSAHLLLSAFNPSVVRKREGAGSLNVHEQAEVGASLKGPTHRGLLLMPMGPTYHLLRCVPLKHRTQGSAR